MAGLLNVRSGLADDGEDGLEIFTQPFIGDGRAAVQERLQLDRQELKLAEHAERGRAQVLLALRLRCQRPLSGDRHAPSFAACACCSGVKALTAAATSSARAWAFSPSKSHTQTPSHRRTMKSQGLRLLCTAR